MNTIYVKNSGYTKTTIYDNKKKKRFRQYKNITNQDADYDGNKANITINTDNDGKVDKYNIQLNNKELE